MACNYIIRLPNGRTEKIPANFGKMKPSEVLKGLLGQLGQFSENDIKNYLDKSEDNITYNIESIVGNIIDETYNSVSDGLHYNTVKKIVIDNISDPTKIVSEINKRIQESGDYINLEKALKGLQRTNKAKFKALERALTKRITPKYFKGVETINVIGKTNLKSEIKRLSVLIDENSQLGFDNNLNLVIRDFLKASRKLLGESAETFFPINATVGQNNTISTQGFSFFQHNNNLSLFLATFKKIATDVDKGKLRAILSKIKDNKKITTLDLDLTNFDVDKFFNGYFDQNTFIEGDFHKLFNYRSLSPVIGEIINLVSEHLADYNGNNASNEYAKYAKYAFGHLDPNVYGRDFFTDQKIQEEIYNKELRQEKEIKEKLLSQKTAMLLSQGRNTHFNPTDKITEDLYQTIKEKVVIGQDLIKFSTKSGTGVFGVVTGIFPKKSGAYITGVLMDVNRNVQKFSEVFNKEIEFRKYEGIIDDAAEFIDQKEGMLIASDTGFSSEIVNSLVRKGDVLNGNLLVVAVYAGELRVRSLKEPNSTPYAFTGYKHIKSITSQIALNNDSFLEKIQLNEYTPIKDMSLLSTGDIFIDPKTKLRKTILFTDSEKVYAIIPGKKGNVIVGVDRTSIKSGLSHTFKQLTADEIRFVSDEITKTKSTRSTSTFVNSNKAKDNDFVYYLDGNNYVIGKVVDSKIKKAVFLKNGKIVTESFENKDVTFITDRDISSDFSFKIAKSNEWKVDLLKTDDNLPKNVELKYIIPIDEDVDSMMLLPGDYANIGRYITANYKYNIAEFKDATDQILKLMKERGDNVTGKSLYGTIRAGSKENANLERNLEGLYPVYNFSLLNPDIKQELETDVLFPGAYFSLYDGTSNIYRVINVIGSKVTTNVNTISDHGKLITIEKEFDSGTLLAGDGVKGSISNLYLQYRNNKIDDLVEIISRENITAEGVKNSMLTNKFRSKVLKSVQKIYKELDIKVAVVNDTFEDNQLAKLETIVDEDGNSSSRMLVNKKFGTAEDVIHETLHLFLIPYRYKNPESYNALLESLNDPDIAKEDNINAKEELFIKKVSKAMVSDEDLVDEYGREINPEELITHFLRIIQDINPEYNDMEISLVTLDLLNTPIYEVLGLEDAMSTSHPMYNLGMLITEPQLREWMDKNSITLKCQ